MTTKVIVTEAQIRRAIRAVHKEGFSIAGVRVDGTIIIGEPSAALNANGVSAEDAARWLDPSKFVVNKKAADESYWADPSKWGRQPGKPK